MSYDRKSSRGNLKVSNVDDQLQYSHDMNVKRTLNW